MPVKADDFIFHTDFLDDLTMAMFAQSDNTQCPNTEPLISEDIWKKFELDLPEFSSFDDILDELNVDSSSDTLFSDLMTSSADNCEIRNHDCMWAGHCGSKEHPADEPRHFKPYTVPLAPGLPKTPAPVKQIRPAPSQQSLLKPTLRTQQLATITPQTPPMSDDEENKGKTTQVLQILQQAISEYDPDEDDNQDLCAYFQGDNEDDLVPDVSEEEEEVEEEEEEEEDDDEEEDEEEPVVQKKPQLTAAQMRPYYAAENDHSYHKDKNASMRVANLGIETPSDSEEEIDVVSVGDKLNVNSRITSTLPNNPSRSYKQQLQRTMANAMSIKRNSNGIKTILPMRKPITSPDYSPVKRKAPSEPKGTKRARQYRSGPPYKRRAMYGNSSDSEPESSEKRSLHNNMERQRRIDLRNAFEVLRQLVPEVLKKERAAKVVILREAARYCRQLTATSDGFNRQYEDLKRHQERLRGRVSMLRRNLAAKR